MADFTRTNRLRRALGKMQHVTSVDEITIEDRMIQFMSLEIRALGPAEICRLDVHSAKELFEFYTEGLSELPRRLFAPYPLFHTPSATSDDTASRIRDWKRETDWTALNLVCENRIVAFGLLKRFSTEHVTSSIAVRDGYLKQGLGQLLQTIIVEQARLLMIKRFHIKVLSDNLASIRLHEKCGFKVTRVLPPSLYRDMLIYLGERDRRNGKSTMNRQILEMVVCLE
jgi:RimJ/RimL family protein N-acetyltransferase